MDVSVPSRSSAIIAAAELLFMNEEIGRSLLYSSWAQEDQLLLNGIADGLYFFANNERVRRTYFRVQEDVNSRAPSHAPKTGEWDYQHYFLTRKEYERKNPYRRNHPSGHNPQPPGLETSTIENPAEEYFVRYTQQQSAAASNAQCSISHNPILTAKQQLRDVVIRERATRQHVAMLQEEFFELCRLRRDRNHRFALSRMLPLPISSEAAPSER
jgi:hypothetical protein